MFRPSPIADHLNDPGTSLCFCESQISVIKRSQSAGSQALFQALGIPGGTRLVPCAGDCCGGTPPHIGRHTKNCPVQYNAVGLGSEVKGGLARHVLTGDHQGWGDAIERPPGYSFPVKSRVPLWQPPGHPVGYRVEKLKL